jgi:hypothetical protein
MSFKRLMFVVFALALAISLSPTKLAAQTSTTGAIIGTVTDPSGAVVPNATVDLKDNAKGATQSTKTSGAGIYQFNLLDPSNYTITVTASGFHTAKQTVELPLGTPITINIALSVAGGGTTVTVTEAAPLVQTESGDTATALSQQQISQVPNPGNDLSAIAQLAPGVVVNTQGGFGNVEAFGLPATSNLFTVNGMDDNDPFLNLNNSGATNLLLGANEIQEADVVTNGYSTSVGTFAGINVNYITKSGSNDFHGNLAYFWNGRTMNANSWFNNAAGRDSTGKAINPRPFDNSNQWAASIGGPVKKDKFFFYLNTEGLRVLIPVPALVQIPSPQFEAATIANLQTLAATPGSGITSASIPFYCQNLAGICPGVGPLPGSGNGMFNFYNGVKSVANAVNNLGNGGCDGPVFSGNANFGDPTLTNAAGQPLLPCALSLRETPINFAPEKLIAGRADWNIGANDRAFLRMQYDQGIQPTNTDPVNPLFNTQSNQPEYQGQLSETHTFGPTMVNQLLIASTWYSAIFKAANQTKTLAAFPTTFAWSFSDGSFSDLGGINYVFPQGRNVNQDQIDDDVSKTWGNHTIKFGGKFHKNYISDHDNGVLTSGLEIPLGEFFFYNGSPGILLKNYPVSQDLPIRNYEIAGYVLDEWRIKSNLTISPGVRLEHASNPTCVVRCFAQLSAPFGTVAANPSAPYNTQIQINRKQALLGYQNMQWEPRISFAWQPFGTATGMLKSNLVVRGGIGIFYDIFPGSVADNMAQNSPLYNAFTILPALIGGACPGALSPNEAGNLFGCADAANAAFNTAFFGGGNSTPTPPGVTITERKTQAPQFQKWNLEIQKGFGANTSFSVQYVGNHGLHIPLFNNSVNAFCDPTVGAPPPNGCMGLVTSLPRTAPSSQFAQVTEIFSAGVSNYHGMVASFQHRLSRWTQGIIQLNYTYSHALDDVSNGGFFNFSNRGQLFPQDPHNFKGNYGSADYDIRHNFNGNYVWELPIKTALRGHGSDYLTRGWQVSGTIFARTALPWTVVDASLSSTLNGNNYFANVFPNIAGGITSVNCASEKFAGPGALATGTKCLKRSNFVLPETSFGSPGLRNLFRGPKYFDTDFTIIKYTKFPRWERGSLGLGLQFFNFFNHPNFNLPRNNVRSGTFGTLQSEVSPPTSILGSFLGGDASPRLIQIKATLNF